MVDKPMRVEGRSLVDSSVMLSVVQHHVVLLDGGKPFVCSSRHGRRSISSCSDGGGEREALTPCENVLV